MDWLSTLLTPGNVSLAATILLYSFVIFSGVMLGKIKILGVSLGVTFVLFVGILLGHFGYTVQADILHFIREFGLILFVFSIGLQVGPGFFSSFKKGGVRLNLLASLIILLNVVIVVAIFYIDGNTSIVSLVGVLSGAVTNTPGLGAAQQAILQTNPDGFALTEQMAMGYAAAYPLGVIGIILSMLLVKAIFRANIKEEIDKAEHSGDDDENAPVLITLVLTNALVDGKTVKDLHDITQDEFVISRIGRTDGSVIIPTSKTEVHVGDKLFFILEAHDVDRFKTIIGPEVEMNWEKGSGTVVSRRVLITKSEYNGVTLGNLKLHTAYSLNATRVNRAGVDLLAASNLRLQVGDRITIVGKEEDINRLAERLGNSMKRLNEPNIITIFIGIFLGILAGSIPFAFPGISVPVKLGLAGGPLVVAILISRFGYKIKLVTYTSTSASLMMREIGICLFLASVGIAAGAGFADTVFNATGLKWVLWGFIITFVPLMITGIIARKCYNLNLLAIMGLFGGSMTDPPALAYAGNSTGSDVPAVAYSTVYPLTMFLRVVTAQILVLLLI